MASKILLCISAEQATVALWKGRELHDLRSFPDTEAGWAAFEVFLRRTGRAPISVIVDTIDEDYRFETLPHAAGGDRSQLVGRKLRQIYRTTPFASAAFQERTTGRRRDDQYLFTALTSPELLAPWLRTVNTLRLPIAGIHPLPIVTLSIVDRLKLKQPNLLLVSKNAAGLRQTFCKNLKFRISRLTPPQGSREQPDAYYAEEIGSTRMYLDALTVTHVDDVVTVLILDQDGSLHDLPAAISHERPNLECLRLSPADLAERLGVTTKEMAASPDALHLRLLAGARPTINLVPPTLKTRLQVHFASKLVYAASGAIALFGLLWAAIGGYQVMRSGDEILRLSQETRYYQDRYRQVTERFPQAPVSAEVLRGTVETAKRIELDRRTPQTMLTVLGAALNVSPDIGLTRIDWAYGKGDLPASGAQSANLGAGTVDEAVQVGVISAEVMSYSGDHRATLARIQEFTQQLAASEKVAEVRVLRLPLDLDSSTDLRGSTATRQSAPTAPFQVAVVLRHGI